jgi:hypothetical protein
VHHQEADLLVRRGDRVAVRARQGPVVGAAEQDDREDLVAARERQLQLAGAVGERADEVARLGDRRVAAAPLGHALGARDDVVGVAGAERVPCCTSPPP